MIETHVVNALLKTTLREGPLFSTVNFINGLVAPSFLFCAGFALAITLQRRWQEYTHAQKPLWRYFLRLAFILVVGYSLHLPFFSLHRMAVLHDGDAWISFFQVDILQVISISLGLLVLLALGIREKKTWFRVTVLLALIITFVSPVIREMDFSTLPVWLRPYLTARVKSIFPLFPWAAFLIFGTVIGHAFVNAVEQKREGQLMRQLQALAVLAILLAILFEVLPVGVYQHHDFWGPRPEFFFVRLGLVVTCLLGFWRFERTKKPASKSIITTFGQESLLVYVVHLLIIYGQDYDWNLVRWFGPNLNYEYCAGIYLVLAAAMFILAYCWHRLKKWNAQTARFLQFAVLGGIVLRFVTK